MTFLRHAGRLARDVLLSGTRTGRWWLVALVPALLLAALAVLAAKATVPTAVYVLM